MIYLTFSGVLTNLAVEKIQTYDIVHHKDDTCAEDDLLAVKSLPSASAGYLQYNLVLAKARHYEVVDKDKSKAKDKIKDNY